MEQGTLSTGCNSSIVLQPLYVTIRVIFHPNVLQALESHCKFMLQNHYEGVKYKLKIKDKYINFRTIHVHCSLQYQNTSGEFPLCVCICSMKPIYYYRSFYISSLGTMIFLSFRVILYRLTILYIAVVEHLGSIE